MSSAGTNSVERLVNQLQDADRGVVRRAVDALVAMAPQEPLVAELLENCLKEATIRWQWPVAYTLGRVAEASGGCLDVLAKGLGSEDQDVRWATQRLMTELGSTQQRAREVLLQLLAEGSPNQRRMAVYCLRDIDLTDERSARAIAGACEDAEPLVRVAAVTSLANSQSLAAASTEVLRRLVSEDPDKRVRNAARFALTKAERE